MPETYKQIAVKCYSINVDSRARKHTLHTSVFGCLPQTGAKVLDYIYMYNSRFLLNVTTDVYYNKAIAYST